MLRSLYCVSFVSVVLGQNPIVNVEDGTVRGTEDRTEGKGIPFHAFRGIPYAAPPVGDLRFMPPQPAHKWTGIFNATKDGPDCLQIDFGTNNSTGDEDCLTINIYKPLSCSSPLPTMVWVYGGGFILGSSSYERYGPDYFLDNCVCFVSFNYRLGILGFLSTADGVVPGNNGLKDQRFALQWIQRNIEAFGCSKDNILLFGQSAGAASVSILSQSDSTKGLFHKLILQSGSSLCQWSRVRKPRTQAFAVGALLGIITNNSTILVEEMKKKPAQNIQRAGLAYIIFNILRDPLNELMGIGPVIEPPSPGAILTQNSYQGLLNGKSHKIPTMMGFTSNEGAAIDIVPISLILRAYSYGYTNFLENVVPVDMNISNFVSHSIVSILLTNYYFGIVRLLNFQNYPQFIQFVSDTVFMKSIVKNSQLQAKLSTVFLYEFSFEDPWGTSPNKSVTGVAHADELNYLFRNSRNGTISIEANRIRLLLCKLWTNMAYTGDPNINPDNTTLSINWKPTGYDVVQLLNISGSSIMVREPHKTTLKLWDYVYDTYGRKPFDTY